MSSFAVKTDAVHLVFAILVLVFGGALEELLPKFLGVGFPILLMSVLFLSPRRTTLVAVLFAMAAGGVEDAISSLPLATSVSFFVVLAILIRSFHFSYAAMLVMHPVYQIWLWLWRPGSEGGIFGRFLVSLLTGPLTAVFVVLVLAWLERRAALDEK